MSLLKRRPHVDEAAAPPVEDGELSRRLTLDQLLNQLRAQLAAQLDVADVPLSWTRRQLEALETERCRLDTKIRHIESTAATVVALSPQIDTLAADRDALNEVRNQLCTELLAQPPRSRTDRDLGVVQNLKLSIIAIDRGLACVDGTGYGLSNLRLGTLLGEHGLEWRGCLGDIERRLTHLTKCRDEEQQRLDIALLTDEEQARRYAEAKARPTRKRRADGTQYDQYPDGRRVEVAATPPDVP